LLNKIILRNQYIEVSRQCSWLCLGCAISQQKASLSIDRQVAALKNYGRLHIFGGDPLTYSHLLKLTRFLARKGYRLSFWSHPSEEIDQYDVLSPYISRWYFFIPSALDQPFIESGSGCSFAEFKNRLNRLKERQFSFQLVHYVTPDSLELLPEVYEVAFHYNVALNLFYVPSLFSKEERLYITRYYGVKTVSVYPCEEPKNCLGAPVEAYTYKMRFVNTVYETLNGLRFKFKL